MLDVGLALLWPLPTAMCSAVDFAFFLPLGFLAPIQGGRCSQLSSDLAYAQLQGSWGTENPQRGVSFLLGGVSPDMVWGCRGCRLGRKTWGREPETSSECTGN